MSGNPDERKETTPASASEEVEPVAPVLPRLVVGLGNPGRKYAGTRHNIGFDLVDELARIAGVDFKNEVRHQALVAKTSSGVLLVKPQTFMNDSGRAVGSLCRFFKISAAEVLIVYDDVALPLGSLRFRAGGSAGGHNGIKSLISHLHTQDIPRLKIGVGSAQAGELVGHVLGRFRPEEQDEVQNTLATAAQAVQLALSRGREAAANEFNVRKPTPTSPRNEP